jgi:Fe-S-cluster-containing dehydrogenase component
MRKVAFLNDIDLCIGCFACETACKQEHNLPVGTKWMHVVRVGPVEINGRLVMDFVPMHCRHCENPPCMQACPVDAISKRADGIVLYDEKTCIGCKNCIEACPFGAAQYNPDVQRAQACNLCYERVDQGLLPACVQNCPTQALIFGAPENYTKQRREKVAHTFLHRRYPEAPGLL